MSHWDDRFMELAGFVGKWSKDRSTKVGCVIVGPRNEIRSLGYNGFPRGVADAPADRHERPAKYRWTEHAERNAIYNALLSGARIEGCRMYLPWFPCMDCARGIAQVGIAELVALRPDTEDPTWGRDFGDALLLFQEAGVVVRFYQDD
jgi:dCMP deaminase